MLTGRNYMYGVIGKTVHLSDGSTAVPVPADESHGYFGYSLAVKYNFARWWLLKLAAEHNYRLPRKEELLGDRVTFGPNTKLRPERADNYNVGLMFDYDKTITKLDLPRSNSFSCSINSIGDLIYFGITSTSNGAGLFTYNHKTGEVSSSPVLNAPGTVLDAAVFE